MRVKIMRFDRVLAVVFIHRRRLVARTRLGFVVACVLLASNGANAELVVNGGFETPPTGAPNFLTVNPGAEPPGFGWSVTTGNVEIVRQGYVGGSGPFNGPAYESDQWLDLDGYPSAGAISQTLSTTPGALYSLNFAYANNAYRIGPALATVYVQNLSNNADLMTPLPIAHGTATGSDYDWTLSGPVSFTAQESSTNLKFVSNDVTFTDAGIFLDAISVVTVPEPSTFVLAGLGLIGVLAVRRRHSLFNQLSP
jgi:hypothetical protein